MQCEFYKHWSIYKHFLLFMSVSTEKFQKLSNSLEIGKRLFKIQNTEWPKSNLKQAILMVWIISWNQYSWQLVSKNLYFDIFTATTDLLKSVDLKTPWMRKSIKNKIIFFFGFATVVTTADLNYFFFAFRDTNCSNKKSKRKVNTCFSFTQNGFLTFSWGIEMERKP